MDSKELNEGIEDIAADPVDRLLQEKKPASSGSSIAILALLVSMAAVSATGWQWWQTRQANPEENTSQEAVARLQDSQQQLAGSVASFEARLDAIESPIDAAEFLRQGERLRVVEGQLDSLQGQSAQDQASISAAQGGVR